MGYLFDIAQAALRRARARRGPADPHEVRRNLATLCVRRGAPDWSGRFRDEGTANDAGLRLHLDVIPGHPSAPIFVFMPGTNAYALLYGELLTAIADAGFNVVGFDPRGHGRSDGRRGSYTIPELLADMRAVVAWAEARFSGPVVVGGSSQGGIVSFYAAAAEISPRLAGAFCHNLADLADPASTRLVRAPRLARALRPLLHAVARLAPEIPVPMPAYLDLRREPVRGFGSAHDILMADPALAPAVVLRTLASLDTAPLARPVEAIRVPIFALHAGADTIFPADLVAGLFTRITAPHSELHVVPEAPHYIVVDDVPSFLDPLLAWLRRVTLEKPG